MIIGVIAGHLANGEVNEDDPDGLMRKLRALQLKNRSLSRANMQPIGDSQYKTNLGEEK